MKAYAEISSVIFKGPALFFSYSSQVSESHCSQQHITMLTSFKVHYLGMSHSSERGCYATYTVCYKDPLHQEARGT